MDTNDLKAKVFYYCRERHYNAMKEASLEGRQRFADDNAFRLLHGLSLALCSKTNEAMRQLDELRQDDDAMLGALVGLQWAHKRAASVDQEALGGLEAQLRAERKRAGEAGLYHAGVALLCLGRPTKASEYVDRLLKSHPKSPDGLVAKGWIELAGGKKSSGKYFDAALELNRFNIDAIFGKVRHRELTRDHEGALTLLNQLVSRIPAFVPPLVEKMKNHLALFNWDQAIETGNRILLVDPHCLEAHRVRILSLVCREGGYEQGSLALRRFFAEMERSEPDNAELFAENARVFSRACGRNPMVLAETYRFAEKASHLDTSNADLLSELAHQCLLQGKTKEATRHYRSAIRLDDSSVVALGGVTACQIREGGLDEQSRQQVEFLREVQGAEPTSDLLLLSARMEAGNAERALAYLNESVEVRLRSVDAIPYGPRYLQGLDPDFMLEVVKEYLAHAPTRPAGSSSAPLPVALKQSLAVLEVVTKAAPGMLEGRHQLARVQFLGGDLDKAAKTLEFVLEEVDATFVGAHLLMAQINLAQGDGALAERNLERGVSYNFRVRESPLYNVLTAAVQKQRGDLAESVVTFQTAMDQLGLREGKGNALAAEVALPDKVDLFLELADAHRRMGQGNEAARVIREAVELFGGSAEEGRIAMADADLALDRGDSNLALELLGAIPPGRPYFNQVRCRVADIHLNERRDRRAFIECHREIIEFAPDSASFAVLGDAYVSVLEPDLAVEAYEEAVKRSPHDPVLACRMGKVLIRCHLYEKAIAFYREASKDEACGRQLKFDMAEFYARLRQYENAERIVNRELDAMKDGNEMTILVERTKFLLLLARVKEGAGLLQASMATLREARENQTKILRRMDAKQAAYEEQRSIAVTICQQMAEHSSSLRDNDSAIKYYKEALSFNLQDPNVLIALAKLYMHTNDLDQCQKSCMLLLSADATNEAAVIMLADLAFRRVDFDAALVHFQQLLGKRPNYWTALARLVEVMRRVGRLEAAEGYLTEGEAACQRPAQEAGLCYCRGLYEWYSGNRDVALKHFNGARRDAEWGRQAVYNMVKICLGSDDDMLGVNDEEDAGGTREMALQTAGQLLGELRPRGGGTGDEVLSHRLLGNFLLLATRQKTNVERAMQDFTTLAGQEHYGEHVGVAYGLSCAYVALKQTPRARNQLKRVAKNVWNFEDADYLECCWILLADIYTQNGKYDMAGELLKRVLAHNKGCMKAYELAGLVADKAQEYREAATQYERAWRYGGRTNAAVGFKLAFAHMKGKRFADAIDVCHRVLKDFPDYPRIRKEVLDKCRSNLRT